MKLVKYSGDQRVWITGNKSFKLFYSDNFPGMLQLQKPGSDYSFYFYSRKNMEEVESLLIKHGFSIFQSISLFSGRWVRDKFSLQDFSDTEVITLVSFLGIPSYQIIVKKNSRIMFFLKVLKKAGYKTCYPVDGKNLMIIK